MPSARTLLPNVPFFEGLDRAHVENVARMARPRTFAAGEHIVDQDAPASACYLLASGKVRLAFRAQGGAAGGGAPQGEVTVRSYDDPGRFLGWSALIPPYRYRATITAEEPTEALVLPRDRLERYLQDHPDFAVSVMQRVIWVLGGRLRETRIRMVARRYDEEVAAIRALLDQSGPMLSVDSPLHKVPYYLENRLTIADAFQALEILRSHGSRREQDLASLALDILAGVRKELTLYQGLQAVYESVAGAPADADPEDVRRCCCEQFAKVFETVRYEIQGWDRLPDAPGNIVVMNHLMNHPDNTLPNEFQLTLDTHFVSSMIVFARYGDPPIRVIRRSRRDEYGHKKYYDRLGYIYVYSGHVDESEAEPEIGREERRRHFLDAARDHLLSGRNLVICPEGTSVATEDSPVAFRPGAFRLAAYVRPEPLIVPVAVANFDKKITRTRVAAVIQEPFRLSDVVGDQPADSEFFAFIEDFRDRFKAYVREAVRLAG